MLAPTRELAIQVPNRSRTYLKVRPIRSLCAYGGVDIKPQIEEIRAGIEVLVATPDACSTWSNRSASISAAMQALVR